MSEIDVEFELDSLTNLGSEIKFTFPALDGVLGVFKYLLNFLVLFRWPQSGICKIHHNAINPEIF